MHTHIHTLLSGARQVFRLQLTYSGDDIHHVVGSSRLKWDDRVQPGRITVPSNTSSEFICLRISVFIYQFMIALLATVHQ